MNMGVYQITCVPTGWFYIGSAVDFASRVSLHRHQLGKGRHHSRFLQRAWDKYGPNAFEFQMQLVCAPGELLFYEQRLIDGLHPQFNMSPTAGSTLGVKHSDAAKQANRMRCVAQRSTPEWRVAQSARVKAAHKAGKLDACMAALRSYTQSATPEKLREKYTPEVRARLVAKARARAQTFDVDGVSHTMLSAAEAFGVSKGLIKNRMARGWSLAKAVNTPIATRHRKQR